MSDIQRYIMRSSIGLTTAFALESSDGDWVKYDDHKAREQEMFCLMESRIDKMTEEFNRDMISISALMEENHKAKEENHKANAIEEMWNHFGTRHPTEKEMDDWIVKLREGEDE